MGVNSRTTVAPDADTAPSAAAVILADLLEAYHTVAPERLADLIAEAAAKGGASACTLYLQDYDQQVLVPLPSALGEAGELPIDASVAGQVFADEQEREEPGDGGVRLWLLMLDGTDRLGVLGATVAPADDGARWLCRRLASLAALFLVSKGENSDHFFWTRRHQPMTLPAEMQWQLLPALTVRTPRVAIAGVLEPAYSVGGDAFDYAINGDVAHVAIVDSMGHGLDASDMAAVTVGSYRHSRRQQLGLAATHDAMDAVLARQFGDDRFATVQLAELDLESGQLSLINAGHPPPLLVQGRGKARPVPCEPALPVGIRSGAIPPVTTLQLSPGDRVLFFTDGVVENRLPDGEHFGDERLRVAFAEGCAAGRTAAETVRRLAAAFLDVHGGRTRDDATLILLEWRGAEEARPR
ncbi:PP2C family protein-serine/threonine phosphatase [soil metagenome]